MSNPPRIWLDYRPVRIGWVAEARDVAQLATAASWSICLWGGLFNPIIPIEDRNFSDKLIRAFGVDVLVPVVAASNATTAFVDAYPHLHLRMWEGGVFKDRRSEFVDIRHAVRQFGGLRTSRVLKVRGARELIRKYGRDQNFTRSEAEKCIGNFDESTKRMRFSDFENLHIQYGHEEN